MHRALPAVADGLWVTLAAQNVERLEESFAGCDRLRFERLASHGPYARLGLEFPRLISSGGFAYAHFQYVRPLRSTARTVVTMHDALVFSHSALFPKSFVARSIPLFLASAHTADVLTTVSDYSREEIGRRMRVRKERIAVVPNGIDGRFFDHTDSDRQVLRCRSRYELDRYIIYVSRFEPRKNQHGLVRAWSASGLARRGIGLVLVGSTRQLHAEVKREMDKLSVEEAPYLRILESAPDDDLRGLLAGSLGFAYPSLAEGFGIPPLEAAAMGVPVICSNRTAMRDFRFLGDDLFDPRDETGFADRLRRMVDTPPTPHVTACRVEEIRARYSWNAVASRFWDVLQRDMATRRTP